MIYVILLITVVLLVLYIFINKFCKNYKCCEFIQMFVRSFFEFVRKNYSQIKEFFKKRFFITNEGILMYQLITTQLALITGGASNADAFAPRNPTLANMEVNSIPVLNFKPSTTANTISSIHDSADWSSACHVYHAAITPKNGDRNALGQQYSWGTWWDDMH